jgi:hypothetical protein
MLVEEDFRAALSRFDLGKLEQDDALIIGIDPTFTIRLLNSAWARAADEFGYPEVGREWTLGRQLLDAIEKSERHEHERRLSAALQGSKPRHEEYDCDDQHYQRRFGLVSYPLADSRGLLLVHSICHVAKRGQPPQDDMHRRFQTATGLMLRCAGCQRFKDPNRDDLWEFSSGAPPPPEKVSHVMCHTCSAFFFG